MVRRILILCLSLLSTLAYGQTCTSTLSAGAAVGTAISSAAAGDVICLNNGNYSGFTLSGVTKSPRVTVRAVNSRQASFTSGVAITGSTNGVTITGVNLNSTLDINGQNTQNITFSDFDQLGEITIDSIQVSTTNILLENFSQVDRMLSDCDPACINLEHGSYTRTTPIATVRYAYINGGCADGLRFDAPAIFEYSYIGNKQVGNCAGDPHVDALQFYGGPFSGAIIRGNYFYCNVQALIAYDGADGVILEDNVLDPGSSGCGGSGTVERRTCQIEWFSDDGSTIQRNTIIDRGASGCQSGQCGLLCLGSKAVDDVGINTIIRNNIARGMDLDNSDGDATVPAVNTKNLLATGSSGTNLSGSPTFQGTCGGEISVGGNWAGCALAGGSSGKNAGTDGTDVGTHYFGLRKPTGMN